MNEPVYVVARVRSRPETIEETKRLMLSLLAPTRAEPGCLRYDVHQNTADATDFTFYETWAAEADLQRHLASPHIAAALAALPAVAEVPPDIRRYRRL